MALIVGLRALSAAIELKPCVGGFPIFFSSPRSPLLFLSPHVTIDIFTYSASPSFQKSSKKWPRLICEPLSPSFWAKARARARSSSTHTLATQVVVATHVRVASNSKQAWILVQIMNWLDDQASIETTRACGPDELVAFQCPAWRRGRKWFAIKKPQPK